MTTAHPVTRRRFMAGTAAAVTGVAVATGTSGRAAEAARARTGTLVHVFLYGGLDGLSLIAPAGDPVLAKVRPNLLIAERDAIPLSRGFLLTGAFRPLEKYLKAGQLAFVPAVSDPRVSRSHFQAQDLCHLGGLPSETGGRGWLDALVDALGPGTAFRGVAVGETIPRSLVGTANATALTSVDALKLDGEARFADATLGAIGDLFAGIDHPIEQSVRAGLGAITAARRLAAPAPTASGVAGSLLEISRLIKGGAGVRVATVGMGGFDTHDNQGTQPGGHLYGLLHDLASGLAAFFDDLGDRARAVTVMISSEFGRRVAENGRGSDHGHGGVISVLTGGKVAGSVLGAWTGLDKLDNGDVPEHNNVFDVYGSVAQDRFALTDAEVQKMFPRRKYARIGVFA